MSENPPAGVLLVLTEARGARVETAIELVAAAAALGRPVAALLRGQALLEVSALADGLSMLAELGADISFCQTSAAGLGLDASVDIPQGIVAGGPVSLLSGRSDWQIILV